MLGFLVSIIFPALQSLFSLLAPLMVESLGGLIQFSLTRVGRIPLYIQVLVSIYYDSEPTSKINKYVTTSLLILGSILSFLANSFVPFTAVPIIGLATTPIAILLSLVIALLTLDLIVGIDDSFSKQMKDRYGDAGIQMQEDLEKLKVNLGPKWNNLQKKIKVIFDDLSPQIDQLVKELENRGINISTEIDKLFKNELSDLVVYLSEEQSSHIELTNTDIKKISESLQPWQKVGSSFLLGASSGGVAGFGALNVATNVFLPATWGNSLFAFLGLKSGILVTTATYGLLTTVAPVAIGIGLGLSVFGGSMALSTMGEKEKASKFLADVIIAAIPIMRADGYVEQKEKDAVYQMIDNGIIQEKDKQRIYQALDSYDMFDDIVRAGIIYESKEEKRLIKRKLILTLAWAIAKADGHIHPLEIELHDSMARIMQIPQEVVNEIRRLITPKLFLPASSSSSFQNVDQSPEESILEVDFSEVVSNNVENVCELVYEVREIVENSDSNNNHNSLNNNGQIDDCIQEIMKQQINKNLQWKIKIQEQELLIKKQELEEQLYQQQEELNKQRKEQELLARQQELEEQLYQQQEELQKQKKEQELLARQQELVAQKEQYKKLMLVKIDELKKLLSSNQITSSQYEIELKNIKDHIAVYHTIL